MEQRYPWNKSKEWFAYVSLWAYITGLPNFWIEELNLSKRFMRIYDKLAMVFNRIALVFIIMEILSVFTQHDLTEKQQYIQMLFGVGHPFLCTYSMLMYYYKDKLKSVLLEMTVMLKQVHSTPEIERQMIKQCKMYSAAFSGACYFSMLMYCIDSLIQSLKTGVTFNVVIPVWPMVEDSSVRAYIARLIYHIIWIMFMSQIICVYTIVISLSTYISHQYKELQNYFENLEKIFLEEDLEQSEKESKYEDKFKVGVQAHADTLRITKEIEKICNGVLSEQILFCIILLTILMYQTFVLNKERSLVKTISAGFTAVSVLFSTGFFMWNAGDVTFEASSVGTAMYSSGWENCKGASSIRVRKLLVVAIARAQEPVVMKGLGIIELSHASFVSIVKCSYSLFSLVY